MQDRNEYWTTEDLPLLEEIKHILKVLPFVDIYRHTVWHLVVPVSIDAKQTGNDYGGAIVATVLFILLFSAYLFTFVSFFLWVALGLGVLSAVILKYYSYLAQKQVSAEIYILTAQYFYGFEAFDARRPYRSYRLIKKIQLSTVSAVRSQPKSLAIYTNSLSPVIIILPSTEAETLKQHLLRLSTDILNADKN